MNNVLTEQFSRIGARVKIRPLFHRPGALINVLRDRDGEYFDLQRSAPDLPMEVIDIRPNIRHLVLMVRDGRDKNKFLCGHDERHWFTAAVPGESVRNVKTAMEALKPATVGASFTRQGEWFFVPRDLPVMPSMLNPVLRNEPLSRGSGSKPHMCEELIRIGGTQVYVNRQYGPTGLTENEYQTLIASTPEAAKVSWQGMVRDPEVYVRGHVRHSDHKTVRLDDWCRVFMNNERLARHAAQVAFLD